MSKRGDQFCLDPNRDYGPIVNELRDDGVVIVYDELYDPGNDERAYYTCVHAGRTHLILLAPHEVLPIIKVADTSAGGMKYDGGKPRMALLFDGCPNALEAVAQVLTFGAQKYAAHSWQTVPEGEERYKSALLRHLTAVGKGEEIDSESNLHHLAHAACNALFILELELRKHK